MSEVLITFTANGEKTQVAATEGSTILDTALRGRVKAPYSCLEGICQSCKALLISGEVTGETSEDVKGRKTILTCQSLAKTNVEVSYDF